MSRMNLRAMGAASVLLGATLCLAEEWPTYMHDRYRSGITAEKLTFPLSGEWVFVPRHAPRPAWPPPNPKRIEGILEPNRLNFDYAYHVTVSGGRVYFGSSANDKVYCLDAKTGEVLWTFFADGPVRLAPTVWEGKVYFGSDDGYVYCLDAETGELLWKFRAALNDRERVMGNGRLISPWPVRTGVLVDDGIAYFGAGVFPYEGVFLYAVSAEDGRLIWRNDSMGYFRGGWGSRSPQGYILASERRVFVPMGRVLPACFDKHDGRLLYHHEQSEVYAHPGRGRWPDVIGGCYALLAEGRLYSAAEAGVAVDEKSGREVFAWFPGRRLIVTPDVSYLLTGVQVGAPSEELIALDRKVYPELSKKRVSLRKRLGGLGQRRYMLQRSIRSADQRLKEVEREIEALSRQIEEAEKRGEGGRAEALRRERQKLEEERKSLLKQKESAEEQIKTLDEEEKRLGEELKTVEEEIVKRAVRWRLRCPLSDAMIMAGGTLFVGGDGEVWAVDAESGKKVWSAKVEGRAMGLAVAEGRLFVSTNKGLIYCFTHSSGSRPPRRVEEPTRPRPEDELSPSLRMAAERLLWESGVRRGICLILGSGTGGLAYELARKAGRLLVYGLEPDEGRVKSSREALDLAGLYGVRVAVHGGELKPPLRYPNFFADLVVSEWPLLGEEFPLVPGLAREICRVLKPCGGTAILGPLKAGANEVRRWLEGDRVREVPGIETVSVSEREDGVWVKIVRGKLPGAGSWTHQYAGPGNTACSDDAFLKCPLGILWFGEPGPTRIPSRHLAIAAPLSANGRFFHQGENVIMAYDAYNGVKLWERDIEGAYCPGVLYRGSNLTCDGESLFAAVGNKCLRLDAETGRTLSTYLVPPYPEEKAPKRPFYAAPKLTVKVDGDLSDWEGVEPAAVPEPGEKPRHYEGWEGPKDLSGKIYLAWDERNLYFAAQVTDDVFHQPYANDRIWEADCIQIAFDIGLKLSYDREWGLCLSPKGPFVWCWYGPKETAKMIKLAVRRTDGGAVYEAAIPWEALRPARPSPGKALGFSAVIMDSDGDGWEGGVEWASGIVQGKDPSLFGVLALVENQKGPEAERVRREALRGLARRPRLWGFISVVGDTLFGGGSSRTGWSDMLFALDKRTGEVKWARRIGSVENNAIAIGEGKVFLADTAVTEEERREALRERLGREPSPEEMKRAMVRKVTALDARTGEVLWAKPVDLTDCGPPLHAIYHDGLLVFCGAFQDGHFWREFFAGELAKRRITVLSAKDGSLVWSKPCNYFTRPLVVGETIFADPWAYDLRTGRQVTLPHPVTGEPVPFALGRGHHCGPLSASRHCLFMRSLTSAFYDLEGHWGVIHFGGHRPGCHINMIAANGLLIEPEASSGCACAFSLYSTLVFAPRKFERGWGMVTCPPNTPSVPVRHLSVNLGAPGDRRAKDGTLWLSFPRPGIPLVLRLDIRTQILPGLGYYMLNPEFVKIEGTDEPWLYSFGCVGLTKLTVPVLREGDKPAKYTVRLGFCELIEDVKPGERVFDIKLQGKTVAEGFDIVKEAGGPRVAVVREFKGVEAARDIVVELVPKSPLPKDPELAKRSAPTLCTIEIVREE